MAILINESTLNPSLMILGYIQFQKFLRKFRQNSYVNSIKILPTK